MGTYTSTFKLYKPDATEFVDVDVQHNPNLDIADSAVRRLLEYEYTNLAVPPTSGTLNSSRFFKPYSNAVVTWLKSSSTFYQDPTAYVSPWVSAKQYLQAGWVEHPDFPFCYRIIKKSGGTTTEVEWTGAVVGQYPNPATIDVNINLIVVDTGSLPLPSTIRPTVSKYFQVSAGNTSANFSVGRMFFSSGGGVEFKRYGTDPTTPGDENRMEFTGIKYNLEVTGT